MSEVATRTESVSVVERLRNDDALREEIKKALPQNVSLAKFERATVTALMQNDTLASADKASLFQAVIRCAHDGLLPDGREAALVLFGQKATYLPMVGGYRKIAAEHGWTIRSAVVYANDEFTYELGLDLRLVHRPAGLREERGEVIGAYAIGTHRDGRKEIEVMSRDEIEKVRQVSRAKDRGPWKDWFERMVEKTPVRRLFPKLPLDPADAERVTRLLAGDADMTPRAATTLLYGPEDPPEASAAADPAVSQQAEEADSPVPASSAPGDDEPEPSLGSAEEKQTAFPIPSGVIDEASTFVIPDRRNQAGELSAASGKSLAEIAADDDGATWLAWAVRRAPGYWPARFHDALHLFVEHRCADVWKAYTAEREAAA